MPKILALIFLTLTMSLTVQAQTRFTVTGQVTDRDNSETLPGTIIVVLQDPTKGAFADENGKFTINLPQGSYTFVISNFGYLNDTIKINLDKNTDLPLSLAPEAKKVKEIVLKGVREKENLESTDMGKVEINVEQAKKLPALFGEVDLMKTLQLMPGIQTGGEGNTGLYVRGGGPDQNLVIIDQAQVYNTGHLFGFFSVFNSDAISDLVLHKGNMPAQYGGRISSVVDFTMKEGDYKKFHADGGIGLIASRLTVNGPIKKDVASFMVSGRRSYLDIISKPFVERDGIRGVPYYFYDLNGKFTWKINPKNKLYLSGYYGRDDIRLAILDGRFKSHTFWGNETATLRWNRIWNEDFVQNTSFIYNNFGFVSSADFDNYKTSISSGIQDFSFKPDFDYTPHIRHRIKFGLLYTWHNYTPRETEAKQGAVDFEGNIPNPNKQAHDVAVYLSDDYDLTDKLKISVGLRYNLFAQMGPYKHIYQTPEGFTDTLYYKKGELVQKYDGLEPRIGVRYTINEKSSVKTGFNVNNQFIHMVSLSGNSMPFDIWLPSSIRVKPQKGWQYALGYFRNLKDNHYETSVEGYYKSMKNQLEYRQDYVPRVSGEVEEDLVSGDGWSYGLELFVKKKYGKLQGWIGYTFSRTWRKFDEINEGRIFPARYDRIHDLNIVGTYDFSKRWSVGTTFVLATGQAITLPERRYFVNGIMYFQYSDRNAYRMQTYHRLDLSLTYKTRETKKFRSSWTLAVYNVYNRKNPYIYFIGTKGNPADGELTVTPKKLYIFPILPSITYNFSF
jgi:hypothetical protein